MVQRATSVNTGTLLMKNTAAAREALGVWLDTALDPYGNTDLLRSDKDPERRGIRFRTKRAEPLVRDELMFLMNF